MKKQLSTYFNTAKQFLNKTGLECLKLNFSQSIDNSMKGGCLPFAILLMKRFSENDKADNVDNVDEKEYLDSTYKQLIRLLEDEDEDEDDLYESYGTQQLQLIQHSLIDEKQNLNCCISYVESSMILLIVKINQCRERHAAVVRKTSEGETIYHLYSDDDELKVTGMSVGDFANIIFTPNTTQPLSIHMFSVEDITPTR